MPAHDIIEKAIRKVPDFPKPGVLFYDITGILVNPKAFAYCIDCMDKEYGAADVDAVAAIESRGFIFAAPFAIRRKLPAHPLEEEGKAARGRPTGSSSAWSMDRTSLKSIEAMSPGASGSSSWTTLLPPAGR